MKTKLMFAALAAAAVFTACNKENPVQEPVQPINKSVVLNLANVMPSTKAAGSTTIANGTQITLNNYQVFFADAAGTLHAPMTDTAEPGAETYFSFTDEGTPDVTKQFHFLPQSVKEVIVIGNYGSKITTAATKTDLMNLVKTLDIADQQIPTDLMLYGIDESLTAMPAKTNHDGQVEPEVDEDGKPTGNYDGEDVHPEPLFKAEINLHPAVARVEVTGFEYAQLPAAEGATAPARLFSQMTIENLSVINWYEAATVTMAETGLTVTASGEDTYFGGFYNDDTMYPDYLKPIKEVVTEANDKDTWYFDYIKQTMPANYVLGAKDVEAAGVACYAYHVFPGATPRFIAELTGVNVLGAVEAEGDQPAVEGTPVTTKLYLQTINEFQPVAGNIYRMFFKFDDNDLRAAEKCIQVEITVDKWNVVPVTPEFGKSEVETEGDSTEGTETEE